VRSIVRFCVQRPLGVIAVYIGLCLMGLFCWLSMPQELMPDLRFPRLSVVTVLPNSSPDEVENLVTKPLEQILGTIKNVRRVESSSREQVSVVDVEFKWDTDMDAAFLWIQEKIGLVQDQLPLESRKPVLLRYNPFERPVILLSVTGTLPPQDIDHFVESRLRPMMEKLPGVSAVDVSGGLTREIQIDLDAERMNAHRLSILDVGEALRRRNISRSAGTATEGIFEYPVTVSGSFADIRGIREAIVRSDGGDPEKRTPGGNLLRLGDVGRVRDAFRERSSRARYDGKDNVSIAVYKRAEAYPLDVSKSVQGALKGIHRQVPREIQIRTVYDQSIYIEEGIGDVFNEVIVGGLLAYLVLWLFLRSHRSAMIVGTTIPLALLMAVAALFQMKMTINMLTLGGLALGVGMLVDTAVVLMENISRHTDMGKGLDDSIMDGCDEVGKAVFFCVMTHLAAFAPIPFASVGVAQRVFTPICIAVVVSQLASLIVGFTLVPSLVTIILRKGGGKKEGSFAAMGNAWGRRFAAGIASWSPAALQEKGANALAKAKTALSTAMERYDSVLRWSILHRRKVLLTAMGATAVNTAILFFGVRQETMPDVDQDQFIMNVRLPNGSRLETTDGVVGRIERVLAETPEVAHRDVIVGSDDKESVNAMGPNQAQIVVELGEKVRDARGRLKTRKRRVRQIMPDVARRLAKEDLEGARIEYTAQGADVFSQVFSRGGADLVLEVKGSDLKALKSAAASLAEALKKIEGVSKVTDNLTLPSLQMDYKMDETKLARDGLSVSEIAETVLAGVRGSVPTKLREQGKEIDIRLRLREEDRQNADALSRLMMVLPYDRSSHPLSEYGSLEIIRGPSEIHRRDQARVLLLSVSLSGRSLDDALPEVRALLASYGVERKDVSVEVSGEVEEMRASFLSLAFGFAASILLVYIVLVAQFNTLWVPLLAMVAIPLSVNGVAPALFLTGKSLNLMSGQGLMILGGIAVNNSLMLLEFIQQRREEGETPESAVLDAARTRLRPIFMTVVCTIAGLLPLALGIGKGAEMRSPMAVTVTFGLMVSTVLTLLVLPALYLEARGLFEKDKRGEEELREVSPA
jgi:hydrophobic/amphiphilic exporter-1 (mainly G- bacteria), HAE1 family